MHVDSIIKSYGTRQVLTDVFLSGKIGEIIGLLGRNGSGKSTLLKIIFGSIKTDQKFVRIEDKIIHGIGDNRNLIKYLPQDNFLPTHIKCTDIISLLYKGEKSTLLKENEFIKPHLNKRVKQLSSGEKRFLEILLIISSDSKYILVDEPFNGISPLHIEVIKDIIQTQSKEKCFIITDHDYRNIIDISTRIILIHDGGIKQIKKENELAHWGYIP